MIKNFNKFNKMNETYESKEEQLINKILDKISEVGYENLSKTEKEILNRRQRGESIEEFIDRSDEEKLTFDKHGHFLINGESYTEYQMKKREEEKQGKKDKHEWTSIGGKSNKPELEINVYKNYGSPILYYYLFFRNGEIKKFSTIKDDKHPFGTITASPDWYKNRVEKNLPLYSKDEFHKRLTDDYDQYKELTDDEVDSFKELLDFRSRFRKGEFEMDRKNLIKNNKSKKALKYLNMLFNKFMDLK